MRTNLPVTQQGRTFKEEERLISTTDLQGNITYANDLFCTLTGFAREAAETLAARILEVEHTLYPRAISAVLGRR